MIPRAADHLIRRTVRIGVTGLARAGKTAFLTSAAANLLALGRASPSLPALAGRLAGRTLRVAVAPSGAEDLPRFELARHLASLAADPPAWPERTDAASLLALDLEIGGAGAKGMLPPRRLRLEFLDYPGEWLLDLPLLGTGFAEWSDATWRRLDRPDLRPQMGAFLAYARGLPTNAPADEAVAAAGHELYRAGLRRLRDERGLSLLQPGRFLMPGPGLEPPWMRFFPLPGGSPLAGLLRDRYGSYRKAIRRDLVSPLFGKVDRLVVLADLLTALELGPAAYADAAEALTAAASALRWRLSWSDALQALWELRLPSGPIRRVIFAATKADHVAERQRGNLAALMRDLTRLPAASEAGSLAVAAVRCTEDFVWTLDGHPVSAVRGRVLGDERLTRSYPGEVPDRSPDARFWQHPFLRLPQFEPARLTQGGRVGVPHWGLDTLLADLLEDVL